MRFRVVVTAYNALPWLRRCLESLAHQTYPNFKVCVVDDGSTQQGHWSLIEYYVRRCGWCSIRRERREGPLVARLEGISRLQCADDDIVVLVDGDDWLARDLFFETLAAIYDNGECAMTYGQHIQYPKGLLGGCPPLYESLPTPDRVVRERSYRSHPWCWFHPHTFRYFLWDRIRDCDLRGPDGRYFHSATDAAILFPLLELAGRYCRCVTEPLYVHNRDTPWNESKLRPMAQLATTVYIRNKERYPVHERCQ